MLRSSWSKVLVVPVTTNYLKPESNAADNAQEHADEVDVPSVIEKDRQQDQDTKVPYLSYLTYLGYLSPD